MTLCYQILGIQRITVKFIISAGNVCDDDTAELHGVVHLSSILLT